jgi:predicted acetyltransferase
VIDVEIRPLGPDDDMDAQVDLGQRAFGIGRPSQWESWRHVAALRIEQGAFLGAFVSGRPAGSAVFHDMRQWWHGRPVPMAGVAGVKVAPEYRGRGIGRRLMTELLGLIAGRGYPLSALYPATMPLYRSLGWELAGGRYHAAVPARSLQSLMPADAGASGGGASGGGASGGPAAAGDAVPELRRASPDDAAAVIAVIGRAHEAARDSGPLTWGPEPTARWLSRTDIYSYLSEDGFVAYRWFGGNDVLYVERLHGVTPEAVRALWSVVASHGSIASTVRVRTSPADPFWWLTRERDASMTKRAMWMLRVVDAPAAIAARGFPRAVSAAVPLVITDAARPANSGRWRLVVGDGKGALVPEGNGGAAAPLNLGARGLAALFAGTPVMSLRLAGLASGGSPDTDSALDAAFAGIPYMVDDF